MANYPRNLYDDYHAHVYFDAQTVDFASALCRQAGELFGVPVGHVHRRPVGPHPRWSCQLTFTRAEFDQLIPWLDERRNGLSVLVHGSHGSGLAQHTTQASWLGEEVPLNIAHLRG